MSLLLRWNENDRQKSDRCGDENVREAREREEGGGALLYYKTPSSNAGVSNECRPTTLRTSTPPQKFRDDEASLESGTDPDETVLGLVCF